MFRKRIDCHTHTDNSFDANHSVMRMCEAAELQGLRVIAFTDHCEIEEFYNNNYAMAMKQSFFEIAKAKAVFRGRLLVLAGIELGQAHFDKGTAMNLLSEYDYDIVLGSLHSLRNQPDFYFADFSGSSETALKKLMEEYLLEIIEMIKLGLFDTLAHLTYPLRYFYRSAGVRIDINKCYPGILDELLGLLAEKGKAIEVNTSGLRQPIEEFSPTQETVKRFRQLGGEYITIGSDAHLAEHIGSGIEEAMVMIQDCGFSELTFFQNRSPVKIPIE